MDTMPQNLMMLGNPWQLGLVLLVIILLFGKGKVSDLMGDSGKGNQGLQEGDVRGRCWRSPRKHRQSRWTISPGGNPERYARQH